MKRENITHTTAHVSVLMKRASVGYWKERRAPDASKTRFNGRGDVSKCFNSPSRWVKACYVLVSCKCATFPTMISVYQVDSFPSTSDIGRVRSESISKSFRFEG